LVVMEKPPYDFDAESEPLDVRVSNGLAKIGGAIRSHGWRTAGLVGLTPTQSQALTLLRGEPRGLRLSVIAAALAVTAPTASDAVGTLVRKGLVTRGEDPSDRRAAAFALTARGREISEDLATAPDFLACAPCRRPGISRSSECACPAAIFGHSSVPMILRSRTSAPSPTPPSEIGTSAWIAVNRKRRPPASESICGRTSRQDRPQSPRLPDPV